MPTTAPSIALYAASPTANKATCTRSAARALQETYGTQRPVGAHLTVPTSVRGRWTSHPTPIVTRPSQICICKWRLGPTRTGYVVRVCDCRCRGGFEVRRHCICGWGGVTRGASKQRAAQALSAPHGERENVSQHNSYISIIVAEKL